jgi:hypothetical protein
MAVLSYVSEGETGWSNFSRGEDGLVLVIDVEDDRVIDTIPIPGLRNCAGLALSPDGASLAITCGGVFALPGDEQLAASAVVVVDVESKHERIRVAASALGGPLSPSIGFPTNDVLVAVVFGDKIDSIDVATGRVTTLRSSSTPFVLGELSCGCRNRCFLPDGEGPSLLSVDAMSATPLAELSGSTLPARAIGAIGP